MLFRFSSFKLFKYVLKEFIPYIFFSFLVLTILILAQQIGRQADILFSSAASFLISLQLIGCLLPSIIIITLPFALLIGSLMALNRLSSDSEIVAAKACGISLFTITLPIITTSLLGTVASLWLTTSLMPKSIQYAKELGNQVVMQGLIAPLKPRTFNTQFPDVLVYIRGIDRNTGDWIGVFLVRKTSHHDTLILTAQRGKLRLNQGTTTTLEVELINGLALQTEDGQPQKQSIVRFEQQSIRLSENDPFISARINRNRSVQELTLSQLSNRSTQAETVTDRRQSRIEWHKRFALPLACLLLTIMAIPLGISGARHSGRAIAFTIGFALAIAYYIVLVAGQNLALSGTLIPWAGAWLSNFATIVTATLVSTSKPLFAFRLPRFSIVPRITTPPSSKSTGYLRRKALSFRLSRISFRIGLLIDRLLVTEYSKYFALSLGVLVSTSLIFTLFDILPSLIRSGMGFGYGAGYLLFLAPQLIYLTSPFAILLSLLIVHGTLARSNQITALLASGQSILRLGLPFIVTTLFLMVGLFWLSEAVLPKTNREQDRRYNRIKGRNVEQVVTFADRKWTSSSEGHLYSYQFLSQDNILLNTTDYSFSDRDYLLKNLVFASEATPINATTWAINQGWQFDLADPLNVRYLPITSQSVWLQVPEGAAAFSRLVNEATKMSFAELREYVSQLSKLGTPNASLRVELEKKKAFPLSCLTLIIMALPLLSINNRRSTLAGLGMSILIGFAFWITLSLFEASGKQSLLPVWLAAWGAHLVFLLLGLYLILRRRTKD